MKPANDLSALEMAVSSVSSMPPRVVRDGNLGTFSGYSRR